MNKKKKNWKAWEDKWVSYKNMRSQRKSNKQKMQEVSHDTDSNSAMNLQVHNQLKINHKRTWSIVNFLIRNILGKFSRTKGWKLEIWLKERKTKKNTKVVCGVALKRPKKGTVYAQKVASSVTQAVKDSVRVIESIIRKEEPRWAKSLLY